MRQNKDTFLRESRIKGSLVAKSLGEQKRRKTSGAKTLHRHCIQKIRVAISLGGLVRH